MWADIRKSPIFSALVFPKKEKREKTGQTGKQDKYPNKTKGGT